MKEQLWYWALFNLKTFQHSNHKYNESYIVLPPYPKNLTFKTATRSPKHNFDFLFILKYLSKSDICIFLWKYFSRWIYSYNFYIFKLNNLRFIHHLYSRGLTQTLSKTSSISIWREYNFFYNIFNLLPFDYFMPY